MEIVDESGLGCCEDAVVALAKAVLDAEGAEGAVDIVYVDEPAIAELNRRYRGVDECTDVLAFADTADGDEWPGWPAAAAPARSGAATRAAAGRIPELGEVIVCPQVVFRYADEDGVQVARQLGWSIVHGILHLLGYDHEQDEGQMRRREQALLEELGPQLKALTPTPNS